MDVCPGKNPNPARRNKLTLPRMSQLREVQKYIMGYLPVDKYLIVCYTIGCKTDRKLFLQHGMDRIKKGIYT